MVNDLSVDKTKKVFAHSWMPDDVMDELNKRFDLDQHDSHISILNENEIIERIKGVSGIILQGPNISKNILDSASDTLEIVSNVAVGYDNIDVKEASRKGVLVTNTPGILDMAVADMSIALLLSIARRIHEADRFTKEGGFTGNPFPLMWGADVAGETLGIIGMGRIGKEVAKRAKAFNLNIIYHNRNRLERKIEEDLGALWKPFDELLSLSRYIVLLCPLTNETHHLINSNALKQMNSNAFLINVARGPVISEKDLVLALENGEISGAALDVYEFEPDHDPKLSNMRNVILTPHAGSATIATRVGMVRLAAANVIAHLSGGQAPNAINREDLLR